MGELLEKACVWNWMEEPKHVLRNSDDSNYFTEISRIFVITNLSVFYTFIARIKFLQSVDSTCESLSSVFLVNRKKTICKEDRRCERRHLSQCQKNSGFRFATVSCVINCDDLLYIHIFIISERKLIVKDIILYFSCLLRWWIKITDDRPISTSYPGLGCSKQGYPWLVRTLNSGVRV